MDEEKKPEFKAVTPAQEVLLSKLLKSKLLLDIEYREFRNTLDKRVICSFDASVLIAHLLGILRYRRQFSSKRSKAYKKCHFCLSRDKIMRIEKIHSNERFWSCETCFLNLDSALFVSVYGLEKEERLWTNPHGQKFRNGHLVDEDMEVKADLARKYPEDSSVTIEQ